MLHESMYSVLSRFAQRNVLDFTTLRSVLALKSIGRRARSFYLASSDIERRMNGLTGWNWRSHEAGVEPVSLVLVESVWSPMLRHCPICLEAGFHSAWYQCEMLACCPVHGCELVTVCQSCGAPTAEYGFSAALFADPYSCGNCGGPIAGVQFDIASHIDLRFAQAQINARLLSVQRWFEEAEKRCGCLAGFTRRESVLPASYTRRLLRYMLFAVHPWPDDPSSEEGITVLTWRVASGGALRPSPDHPSRRREWSQCVQTQGVYRATLRLLRTAIDDELGGVGNDVVLDLASGRVPERPEVHPYVLAYLLLRFVFERTRTWRFNWSSDFVSIPNEPIATGHIGDRLSRRCVRAVVLAAYVGMLSLVRRERARGHLALEAFCVDIDALVYYCIDRYRGADCGFVVFPGVPWLPTRGLRADKLSVLMSYERLVSAKSEVPAIH
ncbi:hypothetical protein [Paraburkholderia caribensis]|nr:hypothetical protein [Paraburkholderia caribensis]